MVRFVMLGCLAAFLLSTVGCGDGGGATTAKVDGTVTLDGAPLSGVSITLIPVPSATGATSGSPAAAKGGRPPSGVSDASGKFSLSSFKPNDGAMPGSYLATVSGTGVPTKYTTIGTTDQKVTIEAGKTNSVKLELKKGE